MARIVTRVTSKNFCIVKPSFELSQATDTVGNSMLRVEKGQACINGMDLIIDQSNRIYPPDDAGDYYIALHLWRDSSSNVLGDLTVGVTKQFKGVYLDWWSSKDETDVDALWLGKVHWDGTEFTSIEEDLDKYGRIWAHDILCKMEDWKHPEVSRIILQDWLYKVPDWYVSKEGDVIFGPIEFLAGRDVNKDGTLSNHEDLGTGKYGTRIEALSNNSAIFTFKAPSVDESNTDRVIRLNATNTGITGRIASASFSCISSTGYNWVLNATNRLELNGADGVTLSAGVNKTDCKLTLDDNIAELSDATCNIGTIKYVFASGSITENLGTTSKLVTNGQTFDIISSTDNEALRGVLNLRAEGTSGAGNGTLNVYANTMNVEPYANNFLLKSSKKIDINGVNGLTLSSGANMTDSKISITDNNIELSDATCTKGTIKYTFAANSITEKFGNGVTYVTDGSKLDATVGGNVTLTSNSGNGNVTFNCTEFHVSGDITASKVWNAVYNGFGEIFRKSKSEIIEYGDLVCVKEDGLVHKVNSEEDINTIVGICSNTVGIGLGGNNIPEEECVVVEMVGQVWVKTNKDLKAGKMVKALADGTVDYTDNKLEKIGITLTDTEDGKVRIVYNG